MGKIEKNEMSFVFVTTTIKKNNKPKNQFAF